MRATLTIAVVLSALALDRLALSTSVGVDMLIPTPERTVQTFVTSVATGRPDQARDRLSADARERWPSARLRALDHAWRERHGGYRMREGHASQRGDRADVRARIDTARRGVVERPFGLEREPDTALWKIAHVAGDER